MDNVTVLEVEEGLDDLGNYVASSILREAFLLSQLLVEVTVLAVLQHHVYVLGIIEIAVKLNDIRVVESPLNFELSLHLAEEVELFEHMLEDNFKGARLS